MALNGAVTHYLSKRWGFESKDRRIDTHHAQDAVVIACTTQGMINTISNYSKFRELELNKINKSRSIKVDELSENEFITREQYDKNFGVEFPLPWDNFKEELDIRMSRYHGAGDEKFLETAKAKKFIQFLRSYDWAEFKDQLEGYDFTGTGEVFKVSDVFTADAS